MFSIGAYQTFKSQFLPSFDVIYDTATDLYTAPWVRITPYIVGVGCGYVLQKYKEQIKVEKVHFKYFFLTVIDTLPSLFVFSGFKVFFTCYQRWYFYLYFIVQ